MKLTLEEIKALVNTLAEKINAPQQLLPTYGQSIDGAHPHIEVDDRNGHLYYVIVERGQELKREFAVDTDDLLYRIFADVTFKMAVRFELDSRIESEDSRRQMFAKQEELLGILSDKWREREQKEHQRILRSHPFDDYASVRADYSKQLRNKGVPAMEAWTEACKKYPEPKSSL
jgi:hypothetical protein